MSSEFIFFINNTDYSEIVFNEIRENSNIHIISKLNNNMKISFLIRLIYLIERIKLKYFLKRIFYKLLIYYIDIDNKSQIYFIFYEWNPLSYSNDFHNYLLKQYPTAKLIYQFSNIACLSAVHMRNYFDFIKNVFDYIITFDKCDAEKYGWYYYDQNIYSKIITENNNLPESDIFFVGEDGGRLDILLNIYNNLTNKGFKCDFNIVNVHSFNEVYNNKINFNNRLSYREVIKHIEKTKCILEIVKEGQVGYTMRVSEAICYQKKLLTNNKMIAKAPFFKKEYIQILENPDNINMDFLNNKIIVKYDRSIQEALSPKHFLNFIINIDKNNS